MLSRSDQISPKIRTLRKIRFFAQLRNRRGMNFRPMTEGSGRLSTPHCPSNLFDPRQCRLHFISEARLSDHCPCSRRNTALGQFGSHSLSCRRMKYGTSVNRSVHILGEIWQYRLVSCNYHCEWDNIDPWRRESIFVNSEKPHLLNRHGMVRRSYV